MTILLIGHLSMVDMSLSKFDTLEFYAGSARLAKLSNALGQHAAAMDCLYDLGSDNIARSNSHDFNTSGGFVCLACI